MDDNDTDTSASDSVSLAVEEIMTVARDMQNRGTLADASERKWWRTGSSKSTSGSV